MGKIHVIFISSIKPEKTSAASVNFYRHLIGNKEIELHILPAENFEISKGSFFSRVLPKLRQTWLRNIAEYADHLLHRYWDFSKKLPTPKQLGVQDRVVVLSLAYKNGCWVAQNYAKRHGLPLIVRFDDWWPDCIDCSQFFKKQIERDWKLLARQSDVAISISEGMRVNLGLSISSPVILPIPPEQRQSSPKLSTTEKPFRVCYLGNMVDYGPMLEGLAKKALEQDQIQFEFRGPKPAWNASFQAEMVGRGLLHGFGQGKDFDTWFSTFDCYLVAMFFEEKQRRRVETCFATKLMEYISIGKPIVIWAPETAAVSKWAKEGGWAYCVNNADPVELLKSVLALANDLPLQNRLALSARRAYEKYFSSARIQHQFMEALRSPFTKKN